MEILEITTDQGSRAVEDIIEEQHLDSSIQQGLTGENAQDPLAEKRTVGQEVSAAQQPTPEIILEPSRPL